MSEQATLRAYWAGGEGVLCCEKHAQKLVALGRIMGILVPVMPYVGTEPCTNCVNEAKTEQPQ